MFFDQLDEAKPDPIFGLLAAYNADLRKEKINLSVGIYKDNDLQAELFDSVKKAKHAIQDQDLLATYLPIDGLQELPPLIAELALGSQRENHVYGAHTVGGTGALRIGSELIKDHIGNAILIPNHTWPNHLSVLNRVGMNVKTYPYYNKEKRGFDFEAMLTALKKEAPKTSVILHACCHNPTGSDPTKDEWKEISKVMKEKRLFPFFDCAYQGLGDGLEQDAESLRIFLEDGHEMLIAYSCSKNFSMYCQRVGILLAVCQSESEIRKVQSQIKTVIRTLYSNPPAHGARIVTEILKNDSLKKMWENDLKSVRKRIRTTREMFIQKLKMKDPKGDFDYLKKHKGMFSFIDMEKKQVRQMIEKHAIYMTDNGRINICGLNEKNLNSVVNALVECLYHS